MTPNLAAPSASRDLAAVAADWWDFGLEVSPLTCTMLGLERGADRIDERGEAARASEQRTISALLARIEAVPPAALAGEDRITRAVLLRQLSESMESYRYAGWEWDLDQLAGLHITLQDVATKQPLATPALGDAYVRRLEAVPKAFEQWVADLRDGIASGRTAPREGYDRVLSQMREAVLGPVDRSPFLEVVSRLPDGWSEADRSRLRARVMSAVSERVRPAYAAFLNFLETDYAGKARTTPGVGSIPGGIEAYAFAVRRHTTTALSPDRIHAIGLEELAKNEAEMLEIARADGHAGDLRSFLDRLGADPRFRLPTREALLERYRAICRRMDARLPEVFGVLPRRPYVVHPLEEWREKDAPGAYYQPPALEGGRPGIFYANTRDPETWPTYDMEALSFHEAVPGHHLQIAIAHDIEGLPLCRRHGGFTAYVEGWAHYAERLADEMGAYSTPYDRVGMLAAQAWRAARLVVDTGLHHLGWSRGKAVETLAAIRSGPMSDVENEVDRYVIWPGQALAYKIGQRTIFDLRDRAKRRLGAGFSLRAFHDELLGHGALPLSVLEDVIRSWDGGATA